MQAEAFRNVKNQIGHFGLWCGSCIVGNGTLKELTKRYEHLIKGYGVNKWGARDFDSEEFSSCVRLNNDLGYKVGACLGG